MYRTCNDLHTKYLSLEQMFVHRVLKYATRQKIMSLMFQKIFYFKQKPDICKLRCYFFSKS